MIPPFVSIIIPVYNTEKYVRKCINSVLGQTLNNIEIIIIDDGSTDSSPVIIDEYSKYANIKIIHQSNKGLSAARNAGLEIATGEFIGFVDGDDYVEENMYEVLYNEVKVHPEIEIVSCGCNLISEDGMLLGKHFPNVEKNLLMEKLDIRKMLSVCNTSKVLWFVWKSIFNRRMIEHNKIKYTLGNIIEDSVFNLEAFCCAKKIIFVERYLYNYVQTSGSAQRTKYRPLLFSQLSNLYEKKMEIASQFKLDDFMEDLNKYTYTHTIPMLLANEIDGCNDKKKARKQLVEIRKSKMVCNAYRINVNLRSLRTWMRMFAFKYRLWCILFCL